MNVAIYDLIKNPWPDDGLSSQIAFWREEIAREEVYPGESEEFEKYIAENNLEV